MSHSGFGIKTGAWELGSKGDHPAIREDPKMLMSKIIAAAGLIALAMFGFVAEERWDVRHPDADRIRHQCEKQNITEFQVRQCSLRLRMQTRDDETDRAAILERNPRLAHHSDTSR